ncbi:rhomboid family intramembrane serine protease [Evansella sp. AB-rgal1]|uniref:rhomboid family intramembrane serine protease n=1 Tax=Evansella sp. AB-rgal1 TaxID=3242696 RepID=UPI00359D3D85
MNKLDVIIRYWEIVNHLINHEGMRVIYIHKNGEEVWMEDDRKEPFQIIRLAQKDFDWSRDVKVDIKNTYEQAKLIRKRVGLRSANVINVILSPYEPVDSYKEFINQPLPFTAGGKHQQRTILIPYDKIQSIFFPLATEWNLKDMPSFLPLPSLEDEGNYIRSLRYSVQNASEMRHEQERKIFMFGKPIFTYLLLALIMIMFTIVEYYGSSQDVATLIEFGAKFNPYIHEGEWWRFFSSMFLHIGFLHLMMNSLALYFLGSAVERIFGTFRFIFIYFLAGFLGSVASFAFNEQVSAGASGAIFGCFGALLYFGLIHRRLFFRTMGMNVLVILAINLAFGFLVPMVDNGAHIGGLVGGFVASAIVGLPKHKIIKMKIIVIVFTIISFFGLLSYAYSQEESIQTYAVFYQLGQEHVQNDEYEEGKPYFERIVSGNLISAEPILTETYFTLSYIQAQLGEYEDARENLLKVLEREPDLQDAHYNLSLVYLELMQYEDAYEHIQRALAESPNDDKYLQIMRQINELLKKD